MKRYLIFQEYSMKFSPIKCYFWSAVVFSRWWRSVSIRAYFSFFHILMAMRDLDCCNYLLYFSCSFKCSPCFFIQFYQQVSWRRWECPNYSRNSIHNLTFQAKQIPIQLSQIDTLKFNRRSKQKVISRLFRINQSIIMKFNYSRLVSWWSNSVIRKLFYILEKLFNSKRKFYWLWVFLCAIIWKIIWDFLQMANFILNNLIVLIQFQKEVEMKWTTFFWLNEWIKSTNFITIAFKEN